MKFADRAKQILSTVKANEINAADDALVQKLQKEVQSLRELLQFRKKDVNLERQLMLLKEENEKLKQIAKKADIVEKLKLENKLMKLELQKIKDDPADSSYPLGGTQGST